MRQLPVSDFFVHIKSDIDRGVIMKDIIQIKDISFNYSGQPLLFDHLSLNIHEGEWTALIGQNGSGKSTLARLIDGLIVLKSGQIVVDDLIVNDQNIFDVRSKIGMVFQNPEDQFVGATVEDDVAFGLENRRLPRDQMHEIVEKSLKDVGMWEFRDRIPANLSGAKSNELRLPESLHSVLKLLFLMKQPVCLIPEVVKTF